MLLDGVNHVAILTKDTGRLVMPSGLCRDSRTSMMRYAVDPGGDLLFYRDHNQDGTGNVADPSVIGHGGFGAYKFLFSGGGKGIIYAAEVAPPTTTQFRRLSKSPLRDQPEQHGTRSRSPVQTW